MTYIGHDRHRFWYYLVPHICGIIIFTICIRNRDSDVAKWLEAACYALVHKPDTYLSRLVEEAVDLIRGAQQEDGYINTYYTVLYFLFSQ